MFLESVIRRRLLSWLSPWLRRSPELELKVGIVRSHAIAKDLQFDVTVLNDGDSSIYVFEELTIGEFSVRFSNWSVHSFSIEVRDVKVALSVRESEREGVRNVQKSKDRGSNDLEKKLSAMDPEGAALHEALRKLSAATPSANGIKASILNIIYRHCLLEIHDIKLQLRFPMFNDGMTWVSEAKELTVFSQHLERGCLLRDIISTTITPLRESSLVMNLRGFEIGFKRNDQITNTFFCKDLLSYAMLRDLQFVDLNLHVPELKISSSPLDVTVLFLCWEVLARKVKHPRNGRYLWKVAAIRISNMTSSPRVTLYRLITNVILWLRYLHCYEDLLSLVGYPSIHTLEKSAMRLSEDKTFMGMVRHRLKVISDMEKELYPDAIARARRIGRYRLSKETSVEVVTVGRFTHSLKFLYSMLALLTCVIRALYKVLKYIVSLDFLRTLLLQEQEDDGSLEGPSGKSHLESNFGLNIETVLFTISLNKERHHTLTDNVETQSGLLYSNFPSFHVTIGAISVKYSDNIFEQSLLLASGKFTVSTTILGAASAGGSSSRSAWHGARGHQDGNLTSLETIIWGEPLANHLSSVIREYKDTDPAVAGGGSYLQKFLGEMWMKWQATCHKFEETDAAFTSNLFILFEIKSYAIYPGPSSSASGFLKCNLMVGKLNLALRCSSTASIALLFRQMNQAFCWREDSRNNLHSAHPKASGDQSDISWNSKYRYYLGDVKEALLKILPEKHIELGAFIAGPQIEISFQKDGFIKGNNMYDDCQLAFELHDIEIALWPTSESDLNKLTKCNKYGDSEPKNVMLDEPFKLDIATADEEKYMSKMLILLSIYLRSGGLKAYVENFRMKQKMQFFELNPLIFQLSSFRKYGHSFTGSSIALSGTFYGIASGITTQLYMDGIHILVQAVLDVLSERILSVETVPIGLTQESVLKDLAYADSKDEDGAMKESLFLDKATSFLIKGDFKLCQIDLILQKSWSSNELGSFIKSSDAGRIGGHSMLDHGIRMTLKETSINMLCEESKMEVLLDLLKIQSTVFRYDSKTRSSDYSPSETLTLSSLHSLYETAFSNLTVTLCWGSPQQGTMISEVDGTVSISDSHTTETDAMASFLGRWLVINISIGELLLVKNSVKDFLLGAHEMKKLILSLSVGGEFQLVSLKIQGGLVLIEVGALAACFGLCASYIQFVQDFLHSVQSSCKHTGKTEHVASTITLNGNPSEDDIREVLHSSDQNGSEQMKVFTLQMSQFSLVLAAEEESGVVREIIQEVDLNLKFELVNKRRKFLFELLRISVASQVSHANDSDEMYVPHFSSTKSRRSPPVSSSENLIAAHGQLERAGVIDCESSSRDASEDSSAILVVRISHKRFILKHCRAFIHVDTIDNGPASLIGASVGGGSISGVDLTISLSEIEMILSAVGSLSRISSKGTTNESKPRQWFNNQEIVSSVEELVPNGAVVAIQDVDQHMYFAVEGERDKYSLVGVLHYSLAGERAFFRVNYQSEGMWRSSNQWFSLLSLHAKDESGQPLRLTYRRGSGFVEVSSRCDSRSSLFRAVSCKPESIKGDVGWDPYNQLIKGTFYLLNKKNDCAIAFVNGIPEFVRKPGNPFKLKVFQETDLCHNSIVPNSSIEASTGTILQHNGNIAEGMSGQGQCSPLIDIKVEKISLTIVHELLDEEDLFPLLQSSIDNTQLIVQILPAKVRIVCTMTTWLDYFDSEVTSWRHLVNPVEVCIFCHSRFLVDDRDIVKHVAPLYFYCRTKELDISLNEVSLDILLFVIGKLDIAGPFSVKSATIIPNRCKVENQTGATLLCQFYSQQRLKIAQMQSAYIRLKHSVLADQVSPPAVSIQLGFLSSVTTAPIHLSLSETQTVAWRTRIVSLDGSKTYPGPFLVIDIARNAEDGLSIVVSPLIRVHNETNFSMELRFQRPQQEKDEVALALLKKKGTLDDSMGMFDAVNLSGGLKKAIASLTLGNFLFSFRPEIPQDLLNTGSSLSVEWSDDIRGGKAVRLPGVFDKLSYKVRRALSSESVKISFTTACCTVNSSNSCMGKLHFLIQSCTRDVPIRQPDDGNEHSPVALKEQKEIFLLPTVRVSNFLQSEIIVTLSDSDQVTTTFGNQATLSSGSTADFYANPAIIYFNVTLTAFSSSCKPLNSSDWVKRLLKNGKDISFLDVNLDFGGGKYIASLRLSRGRSGILEAFIFTPYALKNKTGFPLYICTPNQKPLPRDEMRKLLVNLSPDMGLYLPPDSITSWFLKSTKLRIHLLEDHICETALDLNSLSGLSEVKLDMDKGMKNKYFTKFGVAVAPAFGEVPAQLVTMVPRYVVINNSEKDIMVRQCYLEDDMASMIIVKSGQRAVLMLCDTINRREFSLFENFIRKHRSSNDDLVLFVQFQLSGTDFGWSGPVCVASLGRFFLKFRRQRLNQGSESNKNPTEFANVYVVEDGSSLIMHFQKPPSVKLPYRIENRLHDARVTYYQKDSSEFEDLPPDSCIDYVWDDLTLPHKLVVQIGDIHQLHEINLDKVREWKPFFKVGRYEGLSSHMLPNKKLRNDKSKVVGLRDLIKVGYEVYADGPTRVLCISEISDSQKVDQAFHSCGKIRLRIPHLAIHIFELKVDGSEPSVDTQILISRLRDINMDALFTDRQKYSQISVQSLDVVPRWVGAPFAAVLRRHHLPGDDPNDCILKIVIILQSTNSTVRHVKYSSIILQPVDINLDEETLMKFVPFWRSSLSESNKPSRQYYFDHFEIHPIKIFANFLPGDSYSSYSSAQETLRSFIHSVVKIPPMRNVVVELNGVSVTHALVTMRELSIRCAQHYTWYAMRAIYIAKGSPLLPPGFASIFDDLASSSLDVFFDPSHGLMKLPGLTLGTFKLLSKSIGGKGFSGTKRYFGDLRKTLMSAGSNVLFAAVTEVSDSVLKGAETSGFDGMFRGFHQGILKLAMEPSVLGSALLEGGPDRVIKLDKSPGVDELYIEGYLQAMLDMIYKQEYLQVRVIDNQVNLKNMPPNSSLIEEIMDRVREFLVSKALLKGDPSTSSRPLRHLRGETEWRIGPTVMTLCEHLFVSFAIRMLRNQASKVTPKIKWKKEPQESGQKDEAVEGPIGEEPPPKGRFIWKWGIGQFVLSGVLAYVDGRLCRYIPNPVARRIVSGFLLSFLDKKDDK
ncbi:uncharacterized protein LOC116200899 isoform X2 [Punica granatum]|uniref:Uncharacterized protein LOC116200899 isoform X2 n=1 Tax=Punica granatum TaxID=22663 RepID=A0A6P8CSS8_PUNGR|nr:uncharacterized protein LOC116200899 isoform X2 [Punica granatum]